MIKKKTVATITILIVLLVSGVSAWRFLALWGRGPANWIAWSGLWLGLTLGFILFWGVALLAIHRFDTKTFPHRLTVGVGATLFGLLGLLLTTPAGLSKITVELHAENVWSPTIFTAEWTGNGVGARPFRLPMEKAAPADLEITATGDAAGQIWLVGATWPDGSVIPFDDFQADSGWKRQTISWNSFRDQPVWIFDQDQPATLRWAGEAGGPLTLVFTKHERAGEVSVRWNGVLAQTLDLHAPDFEFTGITLPNNEPVVWRVDLPVTSLNREIGVSVEPDPDGEFWTVFKKVKIVGVPGQTLEAEGDALSQALRIEAGQSISTPEGIRFWADSPRDPIHLFLTGSLTPDSNWGLIIPRLENVLIVLYLAAVGSIVSAGLSGLIKPGVLVNVNIVVITLVATIFTGEAISRSYLSPPDQYFVWRPYLHKAFQPKSEAMLGIEGESHFIINSQGLRGDEFSPDDDYRILAIGGSTTECLYVDQSEAWPHLLQDMLNENNRGLHTWIGNVGRAGLTAREHVLEMEFLLPQYPDLDAVILLAGINDFNLRLEQGDTYQPDYMNAPGSRQTLMSRTFAVYPKRDRDLLPYYQQSAVWRLADRFQQAQSKIDAAEEVEFQDENGGVFNRRRAQRKNAAIREKLPDLSAALDEYSQNLNTIVDIADAHDVRLILVTQPFLWRGDLTKEEEDLLWWGWGPGREYFYSVEALIDGLSAYNERVQQICRQRQVECIDLANTLPQDTTVFFDDVHFTERGNEQVARFVADYLLPRFPFEIDD